MVSNSARALISGGASWIGPEGHRFTMYFFRWLPGRTAALFVRNHLSTFFGRIPSAVQNLRTSW